MIQLDAHDGRGASAHERMQRLSELLEKRAQATRPRRCGMALQGVQRGSDRTSGRRRRRALAGESGSWAELVEAYEAALPARLADGRRAAAAGRRWRASTRRSWRTPRRIARNQRDPQDCDENNPQALDALERLYLATGRFDDLLGDLRQEARAGEAARPRSSRSA